jgi:hypothetical protein
LPPQQEPNTHAAPPQLACGGTTVQVPLLQLFAAQQEPPQQMFPVGQHESPHGV